MRTKKIYIAGAITGTDDYASRFNAVERRLSDEGFAVINPVKNVGFDYKDYIDMGLAELSHCDALYMIDGWEKSQGAQLELIYAKTVGIEIIFEG